MDDGFNDFGWTNYVRDKANYFFDFEVKCSMLIARISEAIKNFIDSL